MGVGTGARGRHLSLQLADQLPPEPRPVPLPVPEPLSPASALLPCALGPISSLRGPLCHRTPCQPSRVLQRNRTNWMHVEQEKEVYGDGLAHS